MTYHKQYTAPEGLTSITDSELAFVNVIQVSRSGIIHTEIDGTPSDGNPQFQYDVSRGKIVFDPDQPFILSEQINVLYRL